MQVYGSEAIRNVAVVGHGGAGKTSLVDALAYVSGSSRRHGSVRDGTALTDSSPEEIEAKHSIGLGLAHAEWKGVKINLLDAPGYFEYIGEAACALSVADAALVVLSATAGVEVGTERVWEMCDQLHLPRILVVTGMDKEHADFLKVYEDIKAHLTPRVVPVEVPVGDGKGFHGIVNLFSGHCHEYKAGTKGEYEHVAIPADLATEVARYTDQFTEAVAATDDALIERYLGGEEIPREEFSAAMKRAVVSGAVVPLLCCSSELTYGLRTLLTEIVALFPSATEAPAPVEAPLVARVFKTVSEAHVGDLSFFRLYRGSVKNGDEVWNAEHETAEKLTHLCVVQGKERLDVPSLAAGDIGSVAKLKNTHTGDTFCRREAPLRLPPIAFPEAQATAGIQPVKRGEEDKLAAALHRLHEEDPSFHFEYSSELGQTLLHGMGERHFNVILQRLERRSGVKAELVRPRVPYRETLRSKAEGQGKHKKQTGGRGQYGDCWLRLAPKPRGGGYEFVDAIVGGVIPGKFIPAVDKGIQEAAARGPVAGYPMVDFRAEVYDGSYHDVDSSEMAFKMAAILAFRSVSEKAKPVLLEPIVEVEALTPEETLGDVMGDLSARRGQILGTERDGRLTKVKALVPEAELYRYSTALHSLTHGRGIHHERLHGYAEAPPEVAAKVAAENRKEDG
ncbi:MAG TPA: elongation factor G [Gemmatimonadales bacterium]|nr:elongation factor G [Gemmatimonadales bacterium]